MPTKTMRERMLYINRAFKKKSFLKGQTLIETLALSLVFIGFIQFLMALCWLFISFVWMEHQLYQAVLCLAQQKEKRACERQLIENIKKLNPLGSLSSFHIDSNKGKLLWNFYKREFVIQQSLNL